MPIPTAWSRTTRGHVYLARLLPEHPLYPQYRHLTEEIARLRRTPELPTTPSVLLELGELFLPGPTPPEFPLQSFDDREEQWRISLLPDLPTGRTGLDPDLASEVAWARRDAQRTAAGERLRARLSEETWLAEQHSEAWRARQEALNNLRLDLSLSERESEVAAERDRQRLLADMERELQATEEQSRARLAEAERAANARMRAQIARADRDAQERMKGRTEIIAKSGSEMRNRMSKAMAPPEPLALARSLTWRPQALDIPPQTFQPDLRELTARDQQVRMAQATTLAAARATLAAQMELGLESAVRRLAGLKGVQVSFPPLETASGPDLTEQFRPLLRKMF